MPFLILLLLLTIAPINSKASETANVITTIKPLHSLVSAVMEGMGRPLLLLQGASSPHDYQLTPSQLTKVLNAKIIFYIDEKMEFFLRRTLNILPKNVVKASITKNANIKLLDSRGSGIWAKKIKYLMLKTKNMATRKRNTSTPNITLMFGYHLQRQQRS